MYEHTQIPAHFGIFAKMDDRICIQHHHDGKKRKTAQRRGVNVKKE